MNRKQQIFALLFLILCKSEVTILAKKDCPDGYYDFPIIGEKRKHCCPCVPCVNGPNMQETSLKCYNDLSETTKYYCKSKYWNDEKCCSIKECRKKLRANPSKILTTIIIPIQKPSDIKPTVATEIPPAQPGDREDQKNCLRDSTCFDNQYCDLSNRCMCIEGYDMIEGKCVNNSTTNTIVYYLAIIVSSVLAILLVIIVVVKKRKYSPLPLKCIIQETRKAAGKRESSENKRSSEIQDISSASTDSKNDVQSEIKKHEETSLIPNFAPPTEESSNVKEENSSFLSTESPGEPFPNIPITTGSGPNISIGKVYGDVNTGNVYKAPIYHHHYHSPTNITDSNFQPQMSQPQRPPPYGSSTSCDSDESIDSLDEKNELYSSLNEGENNISTYSTARPSSTYIQRNAARVGGSSTSSCIRNYDIHNSETYPVPTPDSNNLCTNLS